MILRSAACLLVLLSLAAPAAAEIVRLADGTLVHGEIVEFDEAGGIVVERADTGGRLRLRWEHLPADEVRRIKEARGFTGEDPEPFLVDVLHLVLRNGTTESGVRVEEGVPPDVIRLRRRSGVDDFPRDFVASVETGRMEGLEIYAPDELYQLILDEQGAPQDAAGHFDVGLACEGAGLYGQAREHYQAARQADPSYRPELLATRTARVAIKIEDAAETEALDGIRKDLYRGRFERALELAAAFRDDYPGSRQRSELERLLDQIQQGKREHAAHRIVSDYFSLLGRRLGDIARDRDNSLKVARTLAQQVVHEDIVATLARSYVLDEQTVQQLWEQRASASRRSHGYGTGTFILGEDAALRFGRFDDEEDETGEDGDATDPGLERFADTIERLRAEQAAREAEQSRVAERPARRLEDVGPTAEEWWESASTDDRESWLTALYAETSGHLKVTEATARPCRRCDGRGYLEALNERGEVERTTCPTCKNLRVERLVRYR